MPDNGQVERMNRTIKEATVKRYHYDSHAQLTAHLHDFINAYNYGRRLKTLRGLTPYEYICKCWTNEPERFSLNPHHQMPGPNSRAAGATAPLSGPSKSCPRNSADCRLQADIPDHARVAATALSAPTLRPIPRSARPTLPPKDSLESTYESQVKLCPRSLEHQ